MSHIFVSCSHVDSDFAQLLVARLQQFNLAVWIDSEQLKVGKDWRHEIDAGISAAYALVVIMTPESKSSEYVTYEWAFALGVGIPVVPILLRETALHPRLEVLQYLEFTHRTNRPWDQLIARLSELRPSQEATVQSDSVNLSDQALTTLLMSLDGPQTAFEYTRILRKLANYRTQVVIDRIIAFSNKRMVGLDYTLRVAIAETLGQIADASAVPYLCRLLQEDKDASVKRAAVEALGKIGDARAVPYFAALLRTYANAITSPLRLQNEKQIIASVARSLRQIGSTEAYNLLEEYHL